MSKVVLGPESQLRIINTVSNSPSLMSLFLYICFYIFNAG